MFSLFDSPAEFLLFSNFCAFPNLIPLDTFYKVNSQPVSAQKLKFSELPLIFLKVILLLENHLWNRLLWREIPMDIEGIIAGILYRIQDY